MASMVSAATTASAGGDGPLKKLLSFNTLLKSGPTSGKEYCARLNELRSASTGKAVDLVTKHVQEGYPSPYTIRRALRDALCGNALYAENIQWINRVINGEEFGMFYGCEGCEMQLKNLSEEDKVDGDFDYDSYAIRIEKLTSRGGYNMDNTPIIFSYGFYISLIRVSDGEKMVLGKSNGKRMPVSEARWGVPEGHDNNSTWITDTDIREDATTMLVTMKYDTKRESGNYRWHYTPANTAYVVGEIPKDIHQVSGGLFCSMGRIDPSSGAPVRDVVIKNTLLRLKNGYLPDEKGEVFVLSSK